MFILRPFRPGDAAGVIAVLDDTFESTWAPQLRPEALARRRREQPARAYVAQKAQAFVVAAEGEQILGMVHWDGDFIHALHVTGAAQRRGVGRALLAHAEQAIAAAGRAAARLETDTFNTRSRAFYAALGYREIDSYPDQEWDSGLTTLLLEKLLD
jgi:ribosomal protein S18 acetylase RimI-like enzyme